MVSQAQTAKAHILNSYYDLTRKGELLWEIPVEAKGGFYVSRCETPLGKIALYTARNINVISKLYIMLRNGNACQSFSYDDAEDVYIVNPLDALVDAVSLYHKSKANVKNLGPNYLLEEYYKQLDGINRYADRQKIHNEDNSS